MDKKRSKEIRINVSIKKHNELKEEAKNLCIPLATLVKIKLGGKNGRG